MDLESAINVYTSCDTNVSYTSKLYACIIVTHTHIITLNLHILSHRQKLPRQILTVPINVMQ